MRASGPALLNLVNYSPSADKVSILLSQPPGKLIICITSIPERNLLGLLL